jgi:hypothetical protein
MLKKFEPIRNEILDSIERGEATEIEHEGKIFKIGARSEMTEFQRGVLAHATARQFICRHLGE